MGSDERCILLADDDEDDVLLIREALLAAGARHEVVRVRDGVELMDYLHACVGSVRAHTPPRLVLLDLNMPRKDGREALREIRAHEKLCHLPVVALTTSRAPDDIRNSYAVGVNSYIVKPQSFRALITAMHSFGEYWFKTAELPD